MAHQATRKIYDLARGGDSRPFLMLVSFSHPHDPFTITPEYWERYRDDEIDLPSVPAIPRAGQDPHSRRIQDVCDIGRDPLTEARVRAARRAYYGAISYIDDKLAALRAALSAAGVAENTAIILTSDHGEMLGERGLWYKMTFFEGAARVPLVVHAPGRFAPRRAEGNVSLLDLYPTLVELAGGNAAPEGLPGHSLLPLLEGDSAGWPDAVHGEYLAEGAAGPLVMVRRGAYKYVVGEDSPPQLFDLASDPRELNNLAGDPAEARAKPPSRRRWRNAGTSPNCGGRCSTVSAAAAGSSRRSPGAAPHPGTTGRPATRRGATPATRAARWATSSAGRVCPSPRHRRPTARRDRPRGPGARFKAQGLFP